MSNKEYKKLIFSDIDLKVKLLRRTYGVTLLFEEFNKDPLKIQFKISLIQVPTKENDDFTIEVNKDSVYINERKPITTADMLANSIGEVLYPICLKVDRFLNVITIANHQEIIERWKINKEIIKQRFIGEIVNETLERASKNIEDINRLEEQLFGNDWFYRVFFNFYNNKKTTERYKLVPYKQGVLFDVATSINFHEKRTKDIVINKKGTCIDPRNAKDILRGNVISINKASPLKGNFKFDYHFFNESYFVDAIIGNVNLNFSETHFKNVALEIYHLKDEIPKTAKETEQNEQEKLNKEIKEKKKKKRYFLFGAEI